MNPEIGFAVVLIAAFVLDELLGDPPWLPHPVRLLGKIIQIMEQAIRRFFTSPYFLKIGGVILVLIVAGGTYAAVLITLKGARLLYPNLEIVLSIYILYTVLAGGDLRNHVSNVAFNLEKGNIDTARLSAGMLVSRDTTHISLEGAARSSLESLFENTADGVLAPLFYAVIGGPALAAAYKAVNTMDSMLGYRSVRYADLGWFAARLDDVVNYVPARLTAFIFILAGLRWKGSLRGINILFSDCRNHESPNSAWPEAAAAGVLDILLGGVDYYGGRKRERPVINKTGSLPGKKDIDRALLLFRDTSRLTLVLLLTVYFLLIMWL